MSGKKAYIIINGKLVEEVCTESNPYDCKRHAAYHRLQGSMRFASNDTVKEIFDTTGYEDKIVKAKTELMPANYKRYSIGLNTEYYNEHKDLAEELADKLTEEEKASVRYYTGSGYKDVMNYIYGRPRRVKSRVGYPDGTFVDNLVNPEMSDDEHNAYISKVIEDMNKATGLARELEQPQVVYRAMVAHDERMQIRNQLDEETMDEFVNKNFQVGDTFYRKAVTSATADPAVAVSFFLTNGADKMGNGVIIEYLTKKGARLSKHSQTSSHIADEMEVILPPETKFKVEAIHRNIKYTIDARINGYQRGIKPNGYGKIVAPKITLIQVVEIDD